MTLGGPTDARVAAGFACSTDATTRLLYGLNGRCGSTLLNEWLELNDALRVRVRGGDHKAAVGVRDDDDAAVAVGAMYPRGLAALADQRRVALADVEEADFELLSRERTGKQPEAYDESLDESLRVPMIRLAFD